MQTTTLALLSATTVGTLGTIVALPVDQQRAATMLQKARRQVRKAQRSSLDLKRRSKGDRTSVGTSFTSASTPSLPTTLAENAHPSSTRTSTSSLSSAESTYSTTQTPHVYTVPLPSLPPLTPSQRTPHKAQPSIAITCPDGYFRTLDLDTPVAMSPSELMSPKGGLGISGLSLLETVHLEMRNKA